MVTQGAVAILPISLQPVMILFLDLRRATSVLALAAVAAAALVPAIIPCPVNVVLGYTGAIVRSDLALSDHA